MLTEEEIIKVTKLAAKYRLLFYKIDEFESIRLATIQVKLQRGGDEDV